MHSDDRPMSTGQWFLLSLILGAMFAPTFLLYGGVTWVAFGMTCLIAAIPATIGLVKLARPGRSQR